MRQVNLLPSEFQQQGHMIVLRHLFCWTLLPVIAGMILIHMVVACWLGLLEKSVRTPQNDQETVLSQRLRQEIGQTKSLVQQLLTQDPDLTSPFLSPLFFQDVLTAIGNAASEKIWLNEMILDSSQRLCEFSGGSHTTKLVTEFISALKQSSFFRSVDLVSTGKDDKGPGVYFKIKCGLR